MKPAARLSPPTGSGATQVTRCDVPLARRARAAAQASSLAANRSQGLAAPGMGEATVVCASPAIDPRKPTKQRLLQRTLARAPADRWLLLTLALATLGYCAVHALRPTPRAAHAAGESEGSMTVASTTPRPESAPAPQPLPQDIPPASAIPPISSESVEQLESRAAQAFIAGELREARRHYVALAALTHRAEFAAAARILAEQREESRVTADEP